MPFLIGILVVALVSGTAVYCLQFPASAAENLSFLVENPVTRFVFRTLEQVGFSVERDGVLIVVVLTMVTILIVSFFWNGASGDDGSSITIATLRKELDGSKKQVAELEEKAKLPLMPTYADVDQRFSFIKTEVTRLEERVRTEHEHEETDEDEHKFDLERLEGITNRMQALATKLNARSSAGADQDGVVGELQAMLPSIRERHARIIQSDGEKHTALDAVDKEIKKLADSLHPYDLSSERLSGTRTRLDKLVEELTEATKNDGGLIEQVRDAERLVLQAQTRLNLLQPQNGETVIARIAKIAASVKELETGTDKLGLDAAMQTAEGLRTRLDAIFVQLGTPKLRAVASN